MMFNSDNTKSVILLWHDTDSVLSRRLPTEPTL